MSVRFDFEASGTMIRLCREHHVTTGRLPRVCDEHAMRDAIWMKKIGMA